MFGKSVLCVLCENCKGERVAFKMGMKEKCPTCDGIGYVTITDKVSDEVDKIPPVVKTYTKKKRGKS